MNWMDSQHIESIYEVVYNKLRLLSIVTLLVFSFVLGSA